MKSLKKSMFFTTIMMVVLLIVAVSTATFAWFTASTRVQTSTSSFAAQQASNANLTLSWSPVNAGTGSLALGNLASPGRIDPMIPKTAPVVGVAGEIPVTATTLEGFIANFNTANIIYSTEDPQFLKPTGATPVTLNNLDHKKSLTDNAFYIHNKETQSESGALSIKADITIPTDATIDARAAFRVAIFVSNATYADGAVVMNDSEPVFLDSAYYGTFGYDEDTAKTTVPCQFGVIAEEAKVNSLSENSFEAINANASASNTIAIDSIPAGGVTRVQIAVWYDGSILDSTIAGGTCAVQFTIAA